MRIERIHPTCNLDTVRDGRGGIFTFCPRSAIVEFNFLFIHKGKARGHHFHPEFDEYFLLTQGEGVMVTRNGEDAPEDGIFLSRGQCTLTPAGTPNLFRAITDCTAVALLTKQWHECTPPIVEVRFKRASDTPDHSGVSSRRTP